MSVNSKNSSPLDQIRNSGTPLQRIYRTTAVILQQKP